MTRDEAIKKALAVEYPPGSFIPCADVAQGAELQRLTARAAALFVDRAIALGMLKLDEPKTVGQEAIDVLGYNGRSIVEALRAHGFRIVKNGFPER